MASMRTVLGFGVTLATLAITLSACSSGSSSHGSSPDGGTSENDDGTNNGGSSGNPSTGGGGNGGDGKFNDCSAEDNTTCTKAELDTYNACLQNACKDPLKECYGPDYLSGKFSGVCADFISCVNACDCNDTQCFMNCPEPSEACNTCAAKLTTCSETCEEPACMKEPTETGGKTCSDLAACCEAMTDAEAKETCQGALDLASGNDVSCDAIYGSVCE